MASRRRNRNPAAEDNLSPAQIAAIRDRAKRRNARAEMDPEQRAAHRLAEKLGRYNIRNAQRHPEPTQG